jgi:type I restriction enzyme, S subunit
MTELPSGWSQVPLERVAQVQGGIQKQGKRRPVENKYPFLRVANVLRGRLDLSEVHEVEIFAGELDRYRLEPGDLLVVEGNGSPDQIGRAAVWDGSIPDCVHQNHLIRVRPLRHQLLPKFLAYAWNSPNTSRHLRNVAGSTSGLYTLSTAKVKAVQIPLCPPNEQQRIVDLLDDHLSRLDAAEVGVAQSVDRLTVLQDRLLRFTLTGERGHGRRFPATLPAAGVDDGALADLPAGWFWRRLDELAVVVGGVTKDSKRQSDPAFVEVPYLRVANVQRGRLELRSVTTIRVSAAKALALRLEPGDVLLNEGGDRDKLARGWVWEGQVPGCIHQNHVFRARIIDDAIEPKLLSWAGNTLGAPWAERNGKQSVNLASISLSKIRLMPVPVPPRAVQAALVQQIEDQMAGIERLRTELRASLHHSRALRNALLAAAFSGRLTGRSSDINVVEEMAGV